MVRRAFLHHHNCLDPSLSSSIRLDPETSQTMAAHAGHSHSHSHSHGTSHETLPNCTLENALKAIVDCYHWYAPREGKDDCLSLKDLTEFLKSQAPTFLAACNRSRPNYIPELFKQCDLNHDRNLTFVETLKVIALLTKDAHDLSHGDDRCGTLKD